MPDHGTIDINDWKGLSGVLLWETSLNMRDSYFPHPSINFMLRLNLCGMLNGILINWSVKTYDNPDFTFDGKLYKKITALSKYLDKWEQKAKWNIYFDDAVNLLNGGMSVETSAMVFADTTIKQTKLPEEARFVLEQQTRKELESVIKLREIDRKETEIN